MLEENIKQKILEEIYRTPNKAPEVTPKQPVKVWRWIGLMCVFVAVTALSVSAIQKYIADATVTYMLPVSLKTISKKGFPLAGVQVTIEGKLYGKSDSFGDWQGMVPMVATVNALKFSFNKKTTEGAYRKNLTKAVATDNLSGMPINFNVALPFTAVVDDGPAVPASPDSVIAITLQNLPTDASRKVTKAQRVFAHQTLPQITRKLSHLGITAQTGDTSPAWQVTFRLVSKPRGYPMLRADQRLRGRRATFLLPLNQPFAKVARQVISMLKATVQRNYRFDVNREGLVLNGLSRLPEFWWPHVGDRFAAKGSEVTALKLLDDGIADKALGLEDQSCTSGAGCVRTRLPRYVGQPSGRHKILNLKVVTPKPRATEVYINGVRLAAKSGGFYRYHGVPGGRSYATVLVDGQYYGGYTLNHRIKQVPVVTVYPRSTRNVAAEAKKRSPKPKAKLKAKLRPKPQTKIRRERQARRMSRTVSPTQSR